MPISVLSILLWRIFLLGQPLSCEAGFRLMRNSSRVSSSSGSPSNIGGLPVSSCTFYHCAISRSSFAVSEGRPPDAIAVVAPESRKSVVTLKYSAIKFKVSPCGVAPVFFHFVAIELLKPISSVARLQLTPFWSHNALNVSKNTKVTSFFCANCRS